MLALLRLLHCVFFYVNGLKSIARVVDLFLFIKLV